ncbi:MAG: chorismate lyase [Sulfuriferula sp.]|nr:chorismate lyase [Sulfuriferula sp.]
MQLSGWHEALLGVSGAMRAWLLDTGSLTQRITGRCAQFGVREVYQRDDCPLRDEAGIVGVGVRQHALLRDVYLYCGKTPVVFAHSVLPHPSLIGRWAKLGRLGSRPLGAALFSDPLVQRECLQYRKVDARHPLYSQAVSAVMSPPVYLWARRSLFTLAAQRILVTEVFLPDILTL